MKRVNSLGKREEAEKKKFSQTNIHNIMKKATLALLAAILCTAAMAQAPEGEPQIPVYPELQKEKSFSMILVPDPQSYTKFAANQPLFELQTAWIAQNIERLNIKAALFTGDMVEQNGKIISAPLPNKYNGDQTGKQQWMAVSRALERLDNRLPYIVAQGNHDIGHITATDRHTNAPDYIYPERNIKFEKTLVATCPNWQGVHTMENSAYEFSDRKWGKLLVVTFEMGCRPHKQQEICPSQSDSAHTLVAEQQRRPHKEGELYSLALQQPRSCVGKTHLPVEKHQSCTQRTFRSGTRNKRECHYNRLQPYHIAPHRQSSRRAQCGANDVQLATGRRQLER